MSGKDDPEVVEFLSLFKKLRAEIHDDPSDLEQKAAQDAALGRLCLAVESAASPLWHSQSWGQTRFVHPVDPAFIKAWRVFESDYLGRLLGIKFAKLGISIDRSKGEPFEGSRLELEWHYAEQEARGRAGAIDQVFEFASEQLLFLGGDLDDLGEQVESGIQAWEKLRQECGLNVEGIFLRRSLIPFTLVPRHVPSHYSPQEQRSLLTNLQQAHEAFMLRCSVCGVGPHALHR